MQSLFTGTIFSEIKITAFFLLSNDHLPFCFSWLFTEPWHYTKLFFKMWASISCLLGNCFFFADNFCTSIFILCGFICCDYYYIGETFDGSSRSCTEMPLLFPILYFSFGVLLSYPCAMLIRSKRLITTIQVVDITGKPHTLTFAPYATIKDLRSQINTKFRITSDLYWLSCCESLYSIFYFWKK